MDEEEKRAILDFQGEYPLEPRGVQVGAGDDAGAVQLLEDADMVRPPMAAADHAYRQFPIVGRHRDYYRNERNAQSARVYSTTCGARNSSQGIVDISTENGAVYGHRTVHSSRLSTPMMPDIA